MTHGRRARVLRAALAFTTIEPQTREPRLLHRWLDSRRGIGDIVAGMARQGYDLQLTRYHGRAGDVLHERHRALRDERDGVGLRRDAVASSAATAWDALVRAEPA